MSDFSVENDMQNINPSKTDLAQVTEILLNEKWYRRKTILPLRVMATIATLDTISQIYDIVWLKDWIRKYCEYLTSQEGKGRQDIVDITKFSIDKQAQSEKNMLEALGRR